MSYSFHACETDVTTATFDEDIFEREKYADNLTKLVQNTTCPYVIALSSPWGSGKTFFLHAWKNKVAWQKGSKKEDGKVPCAYFSAWESENEADPLISLVASIYKSLCNNGVLQEKTRTDKVKSFFTPKTMFNCAVKLAKGVANHYTDNALDDIGADMAEKMGEEYFEKLDELQQDKIDFVKELRLIVNKVKSKTNSPILVMIDELDRCKPDYVILLLERIKHLFHVPGLVFVLAIDKEQLLSTIKHTFGLEGVNRDIYLEKFIDIYYELPTPNIMKYARSLILSHIDTKQNFYEELHEEHERRMQDENRLSAGTFNSEYSNLSLFQKVLLGIVERSLGESSVRNFEKKFYKFKTINNVYKPNFVLSMLIFYLIISASSLDNLFSRKNNHASRTEKNMHFAVVSFVLGSISDNYGTKITYDPYEYSIFRSNSKARPYTNIGILYTKYINDYKQPTLHQDDELINRFHQEGLTEIRNQLQEMLDFGKNFDVV